MSAISYDTRMAAADSYYARKALILREPLFLFKALDVWVIAWLREVGKKKM